MVHRMQFSRLGDGSASAGPVVEAEGDYLDFARQYAPELGPGEWICCHLGDNLMVNHEVVATYVFTIRDDGKVMEGISRSVEAVDVSRWPPRSM